MNARRGGVSGTVNESKHYDLAKTKRETRSDTTCECSMSASGGCALCSLAMVFRCKCTNWIANQSYHIDTTAKLLIDTMNKKRKHDHPDNISRNHSSEASSTKTSLTKKLNHGLNQWNGFDTYHVRERNSDLDTQSGSECPSPRADGDDTTHRSPSRTPDHGYSTTSSHPPATTANAAFFLRIIHDEDALDDALASLVETYLLPDGDFAPPRHVWINLQKFRPYVEEGAALTSPPWNPRPTTRKPTQRRTSNEQPMSYHATKFWGHMRTLGLTVLRDLPPEYTSLLYQRPEIFFADTNASPALDPCSGAKAVYAYSRRISTRMVADKLRWAVLTLAWQRVIEATKPPRSVALNRKAKPRLTADDLDAFYETYFLDALSVDADEAQKQDVIAWFNALRHTASAYAFLASEVGCGVLVYLLPHFSESAVVQGLSRSSAAAREGVAWLRGGDGEGLAQEDGVRCVSERVERLVDWVEGCILGTGRA